METETETEKERSGYREAEWFNREREGKGFHVATGFCLAGRGEDVRFVSEMVISN